MKKMLEFGFTGTYWQQLHEQLFPNFNIFILLFEENLNIKKFGNNVQHIYFEFLALPDENRIHEEELTYVPRTKTISISAKLPYKILQNCHQAEALPMMAQTYLNSLKKIKQLSIPDFNSKQLIEDVEELFEEQGWSSQEYACN